MIKLVFPAKMEDVLSTKEFMNNLLISFNVVFPLLVMMAVGYLLRQRKILDESTSSIMNKVVFRVFLPCMLFKNIYDSDIHNGFNYHLIWWSAGFIIVAFVLLVLVMPRFVKDKSQCSVMIQGCFRSNFVIYGVPVTISLLGEANAGVTAILIAIIVPLYNLLAILSFQLFGKTKLQFGKFIINIIKNPLIIASIAGLVVLFIRSMSTQWFGFELTLPTAIYDTLGGLGKVTTPLSFVLLGATFRFASVKKHASLVTTAVLIRLLIIPAIGLTASVLLGFRGVDLVALLVLFSTPNAISSYTMAQEFGGDYSLAGEIIVFTSSLSIVSIFFIIFIMKQLAMF